MTPWSKHPHSPTACLKPFVLGHIDLFTTFHRGLEHEIYMDLFLLWNHIPENRQLGITEGNSDSGNKTEAVKAVFMLDSCNPNDDDTTGSHFLLFPVRRLPVFTGRLI